MSALVQVARIADVLTAMPADHTAWLSPSEHARLATLHLPARRDQYLAGHWLARCVLAANFGGDAHSWFLEQRQSKPPAVIGQGPAKQLSLSHSGEWIAAAASDVAIGIDIEQRRPRDALNRFEELLLADEDAVGTLDNDALLQRWVVKEALIKRDHGAALPEQLAALKIRGAEGEGTHVQLLSTASFHLGVTIAGTGAFALTSDEIVVARSGWGTVS